MSVSEYLAVLFVFWSAPRLPGNLAYNVSAVPDTVYTVSEVTIPAVSVLYEQCSFRDSCYASLLKDRPDVAYCDLGLVNSECPTQEHMHVALTCLWKALIAVCLSHDRKKRVRVDDSWVLHIHAEKQATSSASQA